MFFHGIQHSLCFICLMSYLVQSMSHLFQPYRPISWPEMVHFVATSGISKSPHNHLAWQVGKEAIVLAKKTGSTDNLTGHLGTAKSTDCLIKEVRSMMTASHAPLRQLPAIMSSGPVCAEVLPGCGCQGRVRDASWLRHRRPRDRPRNPGVRRQPLLPARAGGRGWTAVRLQGRRRPHSLGGHRHPGRVCDWRPSGESGRARSLCGHRSRQLHRSQSRSRGAREGLLLAGHHKRPPRRAGSGALSEF